MPEGWSADADPYVPLQAYYSTSSWRVCVVCQLLGMTSRRVVGPVLDGLFDRWPTPSKMARSDPSELREYLKRLGLTERRPKLLRAMSESWREQWGDTEGPTTVRQIELLPGCGTYAADAVSIFCWKYYDFVPGDKVLAEYVAGLRDAGGL